MRFLTLLLGVAFSSLANAQNSFLIYTLKGNVSIVENNATTKAKIGRLLPENAQIVVPAGSVISLICNQANLITLNKAGKVALSTLGEQCKNTDQSVSSNYLKYVWSQLTAHPGSPEKNRKQFMTNVGAVSRGVNNVWIDPRLDTVKYVSGNFPLSWKSYAEAEEFEFSMFDKRDANPVTTLTTKNRFVDAKTLAAKMKPATVSYWTAAVKGEQNQEIKVFEYVPADVYKSVLASFEQSGPELETPAAKAFRVAFMLEQAHYLADAHTYYKKAFTLEPGLPVYKSTLESFKKDYGIK